MARPIPAPGKPECVSRSVRIDKDGRFVCLFYFKEQWSRFSSHIDTLFELFVPPLLVFLPRPNKCAK